jgi:hypothetical protein
MEHSWVDEYYKTLDFFYGEPHHLRRPKNADVKLKPRKIVRERVGKMEVTLNQQIRQFLSLAPRSLRNRLFEFALGSPMPGEFMMVGGDIDADYGLQNSTQPDFLFTAHDKTVSMEMKIEAKCSIEQILKYSLLALAVELHAKRTLDHCLVLLGKGEFATLFQDRCFTSIEEVLCTLKAESHKEKHQGFLSKRPKHFREEESRFVEIVASLSIGYITYGDLANVLRAEISGLGGCPGAEVYRNLAEGMVKELEDRKLTFS